MAEKPFKPTLHRLAQARKKGQILKSPLLTQGIGVTATFIAIVLSSGAIWVKNKMLLEYMVTEGATKPVVCAIIAAKLLLQIVVVSLLCGGVAGIVGEIAQVGLHYEPALLMPRLARLAPWSGIRRIVTGIQTVWVKLLSAFGLSLLAYWFFNRLVSAVPAKLIFSAEHNLYFLQNTILQFGTLFCGFLIVIGGVEYFVKRKKFYQELSMSADDLRRELRETEGHEQVKIRRQALYEELSQQDLIARVRRAKVIIVERA